MMISKTRTAAVTHGSQGSPVLPASRSPVRHTVSESESSRPQTKLEVAPTVMARSWRQSDMESDCQWFWPRLGDSGP